MKRGSALGGVIGTLAAWMLAGGPACAEIPLDPTPSSPADPARAADPAAAPENLKLVQDTTLRLTIAVMINGQGPFHFLLDTAADRTVVSRELAAALKLPNGPTVIMHHTTGVDSVQTVVIDKLQVGARAVEHIDAPAMARDDLGADGMLGVDSLHDLHIVMDFKTMRLSSSPSRAEPFSGDTIVVHGRSRFGQLILVDAKVRGVPVYVVLDSGSQISVGNPALLQLLTNGKPQNDPQGKTEIFSVTGQGMAADLVNISQAQIGDLTIRHMPLAFAQLHTFDRFGLVQQPALLLGMDVLSQCQRVSVDLRRREVTFTLY